MRLLLDTHAFLWWVTADRVLTRRVRSVVADPESECFFSMASAWEMAIKSRLGKLKLSVPVERFVIEQLAANAFRMLDIAITHVGRVEQMPHHHGDPFDRLIAAQALQEDLVVVSADRSFERYGVRRLWK